MKPLNLDNRPCSPISSNCVIWQGQDIPCIKLCAGDTVSDVVFKLATELCIIMDQLNVTNYDLSCLGINSCPPEDFHALIQLLIDKVCEANGVTVTPDKASGCPDCVVSVAPCFVEGTQTTMQLVDYVQMIANRVCSILDQIDVINNQITNLDNRVTVLENTPPPTFTLPSIATNCLAPYMPIPGTTPAPIDQVLNVLLNNSTIGYCSLIQATGLPADILSAVASQCVFSTSDSLASLAAGDSPVEPMSTYYNGTWVNSPVTAADAITNLWISLCDIRTYLETLPTTVVEAGEGITVTSNVVGDITTYTVTNDYLETFQAVVTIKNTWQPISGIIPTKVPSAVTGVEDGQVILQYTTVTSNSVTVVSDDTAGNYVSAGCMPPFSFGTFDNDTGVFTITDPGTYLIHAMIHLKSDSGSTDFWSGTSSGDIGSFVLGLHPNNATDTYVAQGQALIPNIDKNVEISVSRIIVAPPVAPSATANTKVRVKVLNTTNRSYNGTLYIGADAILFSIVKLRNDLTSTACYRPV
ncbi:MAG: hypothetical protein NTY55_02530 [Flavobacteriia bacterium]|nr:hypothetical protein [Flavobacteriia bacterium]